jgi:hypothetical protein
MSVQATIQIAHANAIVFLLMCVWNSVLLSFAWCALHCDKIQADVDSCCAQYFDLPWRNAHVQDIDCVLHGLCLLHCLC